MSVMIAEYDCSIQLILFLILDSSWMRRVFLDIGGPGVRNGGYLAGVRPECRLVAVAFWF